MAPLPAPVLHGWKLDERLATARLAAPGRLGSGDCRNPGKSVTLPTRLVVVLAGPNWPALINMIDDRPGKTVPSCERMASDVACGESITAAASDDARLWSELGVQVGEHEERSGARSLAKPPCWR